MNKQYTIAIAGNPNSGKTTLFNNITGAHQHVGNYPGVTVDKKEGTREYKGISINFVDLPGTYSLTAYSIEEVVSRNFILNEKPDLIIDVIDASNLERNLYLYTQLIELDVPIMLAFNMADVAKARGLKLDLE
jgi:ferrous iron transport protein B